MNETVLLIGSGAREHALAATLARSPQRPTLVCFGSTRNPGIAALTTAYTTGDLTSVPAITSFAAQHKPTLVIIGPEAPLAAGIADALWSAGIPTVGPTANLARIESSKGFTRDLLQRHNIPGNPIFQRFNSRSEMEAAAEAMLARLGDNHVIKDDGLAGGKGVKVFGDHLHSLEESLAFCRELAAANHPFVIEEKLEGEEFSLLSFTDGVTLRHMPAVQDHKRAHDGDRGPNTGGMGTYTDAGGSLPFLLPSDIASARAMNEQVIAALARDCNAPYKGILYGGFMATRDGVRLIEYNARFGDPEALNLLTLLETDLVAISRAIVDGTLHKLDVTFAPEATVCKYLVPEGYPDNARRGDTVTLPTSLPPSTTLFLGSVDTNEDNILAAGSRTLAIVARAADLAAAEALCESVITQIPGPFFHRADIGTPAALSRRIDHMRSLRSTVSAARSA
jgi:phosphoribosylamine--glycine ligase